MNKHIIFLTVIFFFVSVHQSNAKEVVGWVERVFIYPGELLMKARIDPGAKHSSIHSTTITQFNRNGEKWVRFNIEDEKGMKNEIEEKIVRLTKIKRHFGNKQKRIVIKLGICMGNIYKKVEVNLVDRTGLNYSMLIGRSFLAPDFLVDSAEKFLTNASCKRLSDTNE